MQQQTDFLVIGSGISGLSFALKVAELGSVTIITKKSQIDTATNLAQGGIAAVLSAEDSFELHVQDTMRAGGGLCHEDVVRLVVTNGPERILELMKLGVKFKRAVDDATCLDLGKEGGHSARRIAHVLDLTGREIENGLLAQIARTPNITVLENHLAVDLLISAQSEKKSPVNDTKSSVAKHCFGAFVLNRQTGMVDSWQAKITTLCTGGAGKVYLYTTNPDIATGDGIAMSYRAGCRVANLEFVQFHPTCLYHPQAKNFLISEAVRGEGGRLQDKNGKLFMKKYDPRGELATRDMVARAIDAEMKSSGDDCVFLDISHKPAKFIKNRFPTIYNTCLAYGIDMTREPLPVVPAAHYMCGGVVTDHMGCTDIKNLYALGETACTGLHGGNRLASNSLLEAVVFADQAFQQCCVDWPQLTTGEDHHPVTWSVGAAKKIDEGVLISHNWEQIRRLMWNYVGIVRSEKRLRLVRQRLRGILIEVDHHYRDYLLTPNLVELRNIAQVAELIVHCALSRQESRGLHFIVDYPHQDNLNWQQDTLVSL